MKWRTLDDRDALGCIITSSGNHTRWHGNNCKMNPNITEEQLKKRTPPNKGKMMSTEQKQKLSKIKLNKVVAYNTITKEYIQVTKTEFDNSDCLLGTTNKGVPCI